MVYVAAEVRRQQLVAAARRALARQGVAKTSLRAVAAEAGVPLGTMQYVFPTKEKLLRAVIEDVVDEIARTLGESVELDLGLAHAIRHGITGFWSRLVLGHRDLQLMQYELTTYALRSAGQEALAAWQYERYTSVVAEWCLRAAQNASESTALPVERLARLLVAGVDGLILQHACAPDDVRSREDLDSMLDMVVMLAGIDGPSSDEG